MLGGFSPGWQDFCFLAKRQQLKLLLPPMTTSVSVPAGGIFVFWQAEVIYKVLCIDPFQSRLAGFLFSGQTRTRG